MHPERELLQPETFPVHPAAFRPLAAVDPEHLALERRAERACLVVARAPDSLARLQLAVDQAVAVVGQAAVAVVGQMHSTR